MSDLKLNLEKGKEALALNLQKRGITAAPKADLAFVLDVSGSFDDEHRDGITQRLLERLVPWGMLFDPDQKMDVLTFSDGPEHAHRVGDITPDNCDDYIRRAVIRKVPGYNGGTDYSYVLEKAMQTFGWMPSEKPGFLGRLMGQKAASGEKRRSIVLFVTDGDNGDKSRTEHVLAESEARKDDIYFLFIGISNQGGGFPFLKKIGDRFSNTGLVVINDLKGFLAKTDDQMNDELIGDELVTWLKK